ncbi:MAG TPA: squalene/phytoene synthase family protein [Ignavibacteria bacterium]|nr:squalene/phytoene synthase family protein [Ignavibacteria bacterium]
MSEEKENIRTLDVMRKSKTNFFYSSLFLPKHKQEGLRTIYAFCRMTDDIVDDEGRGADTKRLELKNWENKLRSALAGEGVDDFFLDLKKQIDRFSIPVQPFYELIKGMETDLEKKEYENFKELYKYCYCAASTVGMMSISIFGHRHDSAKKYAENLGVALQLTNIIRDVDRDFESGRLYIPLEEMMRFGYTKDDLKKKVYNDSFRNMMEYQYQRAKKYYKHADECLHKDDRRNMIPATIMQKIYLALLEKIRNEGFNVFERKIGISKQKKILLALNVYLKNKLFG